MRLLMRNTTRFEYLAYDGVETDLNEDGEHTGEFHPEYGNPVIYRGNISTPSGQTQQTFYGEDIRYTHTLVMDDPNAQISEHGMIRWKGHMYEVTAVRPSINSLTVALKRMTDGEDDPVGPEHEPDGDEP